MKFFVTILLALASIGASAQNQEAYTVPSMLTFGDSITAGYPYGFSPYPTLLQNNFGGVPLVNVAIPAEMACDVTATQLFAMAAPTAVIPQPFQSIMVGTNDAGKGTGTGYEAVFDACWLAGAAWRTTLPAYKVAGSLATTTGACVNDSTYGTAVIGKSCTVSGSTIAFASGSSLTTYGAPIYIWARFIDGDAGTWTYSIDSGSPVTVSTATSPAIATGVGGSQSIGLIRVPVAAGSHTIQFSQTHSGTMSILAIGTPSPDLPASLPYMAVFNIPSREDGGNSASIADYRAHLLADFNLLKGDGLSMIWVPTDQHLQATSGAGDMFDSLHPNNKGHQEIAEALLSGFRNLNITPPSVASGGTGTGGLTAASIPTFTPSAGVYSSAQSVAISTTQGSVICYNTTGAPATNGSTGCAAGTLYAGAVPVSSSETIYAVAGGTGYADSSVASAAYTISPYVVGPTLTAPNIVAGSCATQSGYTFYLPLAASIAADDSILVVVNNGVGGIANTAPSSSGVTFTMLASYSSLPTTPSVWIGKASAAGTPVVWLPSGSQFGAVACGIHHVRDTIPLDAASAGLGGTSTGYDVGTGTMPTTAPPDLQLVFFSQPNAYPAGKCAAAGLTEDTNTSLMCYGTSSVTGTVPNVVGQTAPYYTSWWAFQIALAGN